MLYVVFSYEEAIFVLKAKLSGDYYDGMTDDEGNPLPKPDSDIGMKQAVARAKRNKIVLIHAGKALGEWRELVIVQGINILFMIRLIFVHINLMRNLYIYSSGESG